MYNRYIPEDLSFVPVEVPRPPERPRGPAAGSGSRPPVRFPDFLAGLTGKEGGAGSGLSGLLKTLHLDNIDTGDILLLLIMLYLLVEGDDLELVIALGLTLLMGLGDSKQE